VIYASLSVSFKGSFGKGPERYRTPLRANSFWTSVSAGKRRKEVPQVVPQDEGALPEFASFEIAVGDGSIKFGSADAGHRASF
jgi:hypothetical protein